MLQTPRKAQTRAAIVLRLVSVIGLVAALALLPSVTGRLEATAVPAGATDTTPPRPSAGCGTSVQAPVTEETRTIDVDGTERWYLVTVPGAHTGTTPLPLVVDFHGFGEGATIHARMSEFSSVAIANGFVVAIPQGRFSPARWDASDVTDANEDLRLVDGMLAELGADLCLDEGRVYATGLSYGAFFTSLITCARADRFAAVAPVAGIQRPASCPQARPVPIVTFHGTADPILLFNGGIGSIPMNPSTTTPPADYEGTGYPANVRSWAASNGCDPTPTDTELTADVVHRVYSCPTGADVEFYIIVGGGHTWPGSQFSANIASVVGYTTFDINASEVAWQFFERFALPCTPQPQCDPGASTTTSTTVPSPISPVAAPPAFAG